jgi:hypothetical protein
MKRCIAAALLWPVLSAWSAAPAPDAPRWYGYNVHAGRCERLDGFDGSLAFLEGVRTPAQMVQRLAERSTDAKAESFVARARASANPAQPIPAAQAAWLEAFSPTDAYMVSSEALGIELPLVRRQECVRLGLAIEGMAPGDDFHAWVDRLYGFHPHELTKEQIDARSTALDSFWTEAQAEPARTLPLLRAELAGSADADFFAYDGAKLLLALSKDRDDQALALSSLAKVDLRDVDHADYLRTVQRLAAQGFDARAAAFHVLDSADFQAFIPQHALTLGQDYALIYMLYPMETSTFEAALLDRLATETDARAQKSLLLAAWYLMTPASRTALATFRDRPGLDSAVAARGRELLARKAGATRSLSSAASLRDERMKVMRRPISDEALIEFDALTAKLQAKL